MSTTIQLLKPPVTSTQMARARFADHSSFESVPERLATDEISQLRVELNAMREQLVRVRRALAHERLLLRNAMVREMDLRAALVRRIFQDAPGIE